MAIAEQIEQLMEGVFGGLLAEPAPPFVFEFSQAGLAWGWRPAARQGEPASGFVPLAPDVLAISPVKDNVLRPEELERAVVAALAASGQSGSNKKPKAWEAALILPDYSTRVAVLEFESFPADRAEQLSLVRFRMKKAVPFDLDEAAISFSAFTRADGKHEVVAAAAPVEVIARYEAPLRSAGFAPGLVTTSTLAGMDLLDGLGLVMSAKLAGRVLTVTVSEGARLKLLRCVELDDVTLAEVFGVLGPTVVFAEDELPSRPEKLVACGFGELTGDLAAACKEELKLEVAPLASPWGAPDATNAGLRGYWVGNGRK
jgi:type IV pilus assembly protein PilM